MKVLVTGATGAIGPRVVHALHKVGCRVHVFSIDVPALGMVPPDVEVSIGDVVDEAAIEYAMQGVDAVIHLAALLHIVNPPSTMREKYEKVNVFGTKTVVDAAIRADVKRVVLFSTIAVYGHSDGCTINEESPARPDTFYAQTKLAAERIVLKAKCIDGQPLGTVLRLGAVYGSRIKGNYQRLVQSLERRRFIPIGNGLNRRTLVYDKDVGHAAVLAVFHPAAAGRIFNVTDGSFHTLNAIIESICSALGRRPPRFALPVSPVRWAAGLLETSSKIFNRSSPITRDAIYKYTEDIAVDSHLIQDVLGFAPQYDIVTGWKETVQEMRCLGSL